jgi:hypothetical protein
MTKQLYKWKIYCLTDNQFEYIWQETSPTQCPINSNHNIDINRVSKEGDIFCLTLADSDSPYNYGQFGLLCDTTNGNITINLPKAFRSKNGVVFIKKISASNTVSINPYESELVDSQTTLSLISNNKVAILLCDGAKWTSQTQRFNINDIHNSLYLPNTSIKGDMLVDDGEAVRSLSVGTNGQVLTVDSNDTLGVRWNSITHDSLSGFVSDEHINHSLVSINSGIGLSGGGTIKTSRTLNLDINSLEADSSPNRSEDYVLTYDTSTATHKKVLIDNLPIVVEGILGPNSSLDMETVRFNGSDGQTLEGTGIRHYGKSTVDPTAPTPQDGDKYYNTVINHEMYYDGHRNKWLSIATLWDGCGVNGNTSSGSFYKRWNGMVLSATTGPHIAKGTIVRIGYTTSVARSHTLEVLVNGIVVAELASGGAASAFDDNVNADFDAGNISMRNKAGGDTASNLQSTVYYKLRA